MAPSPSDVPLDPPARSAHPDRRRRQVVVLSVLLVVVMAAGAYLAVLTRAWWQRATELENVSIELGEELGRTRAQVEAAQDELAVVSAQLEAAQGRITELADEKAQAGDDREVQRQLADYQRRVSQAAASVASALGECVRGQNQLIQYLRTSDSYDPAELASFEAQVRDFCDRATEANADLQEELNR